MRKGLPLLQRLWGTTMLLLKRVTLSPLIGDHSSCCPRLHIRPFSCQPPAPCKSTAFLSKLWLLSDICCAEKHLVLRGFSQTADLSQPAPRCISLPQPKRLLRNQKYSIKFSHDPSACRVSHSAENRQMWILDVTCAMLLLHRCVHCSSLQLCLLFSSYA